jgi:hypothetical protein
MIGQAKDGDYLVVTDSRLSPASRQLTVSAVMDIIIFITVQRGAKRVGYFISWAPVISKLAEGCH